MAPCSFGGPCSGMLPAPLTHPHPGLPPSPVGHHGPAPRPMPQENKPASVSPPRRVSDLHGSTAGSTHSPRQLHPKPFCSQTLEQPVPAKHPWPESRGKGQLCFEQSRHQGTARPSEAPSCSVQERPGQLRAIPGEPKNTMAESAQRPALLLVSTRPLHDSPGKPQPLPHCRAMLCQDTVLPAAPWKEADRQTGTRGGRVTEKQPGSPAAPPARTCINVTATAATAARLSRFPAPQAGVLPAPRAFVSISTQPSAAIARDSFKTVSGPKGSSDTALSHPCPIARYSASSGHGKTGMGQTWQVQDITPELVPVTQRANAPRVPPSAAIPCTGTACPLHICLLAAGSQRLRAPSSCVHFDTKGRRAQVSDCKYLARRSRLTAGSWDQALPRNCTVASQDRTVPTLQHTSDFKRRTLYSPTEHIFPSIHYIS